MSLAAGTKLSRVPALDSRPRAADSLKMDIPEEISVQEAQALINSGALLLDVREPVEIGICSIPGSVVMPMRQVPARLRELPTDRSILVLCHHGSRSAYAARFLRAQGLQASNVAGGIDAWAAEIDPELPRY